MKNINIAVVGATGNVGRTMLSILSEKGYPFKNVYAVASRKSKGQRISYGDDHTLEVESLEDFDFSKVKYGLFSPTGKVSAIYAPKAAEKGCIVVDNTSFFRMDKNVPLVIPEINPESAFLHKGIIANPNCSFMQIAMALKPLHDLCSIKRVVVSTYQSVSGAGKKAMEELDSQTRQIYSISKNPPKEFDKSIAFNLLPRIGNFMDNGYTDEEWKIRQEFKKVFNDENLELTATCVRVPVFIGHSASVNVEFSDDDKKITESQARKALEKFSGIEVWDDRSENHYVTPLEVAGEDFVYVSRIRKDPSVKNGLSFWVVSDNLRKGAALNAVQIMELLIKKNH